MGGWAARKALRVVENVEGTLAIELMCDCQALDFLRPLTSTKPIEAVYKLVRSVCPRMDDDRFLSPDIEAISKLIRDGDIWRVANEALLQESE
jgi:histidine ammonia-lyase